MSIPSTAPLGDPTAVMGKRIGAYIIDVLIGWVVMAVTFFAVAESVDSQGFFGCGGENAPTMCLDVGDTIYFADGSNANLVSIVAVGFWLLMGGILQGITGATPGKHLVGLRVVNKDTGENAGIGKALARTIMWIVDAFPFLFPLVGLITGVSTKGHRRVGDMVAGTLVVDKKSVGTPPMVHGLMTAGAPGIAPAPPGEFAAPPPRPGGATPPAPPVADAIPVDVAPTEPPVADEPIPGTGDGIDAPKWDADRGAYIQWDKDQQKWMTYDDTAAAWKPLS